MSAQKKVSENADRGESTRKHIVAIARAEFARHGFAGASLSKITQRAGITTGAIYHHFKDKRSLFQAVAESVEEEILTTISREPLPSDRWQAFTVAIDRALDACSVPDVARIVFQEAPTVIGPAEWREIEVKYALGTVLGLIEGLRTEGQIDSGDTGLIAQILLGAVIEAATAVANSTTPDITLAQAKRTLRMMIESLRSQ